MTSNHPTLLLATLVAALPACGFDIVRGNGDLETEVREHADFDRIEVSALADTHIALGATHEVAIACDANLLETFSSRVEDTTLIIEHNDGVVLPSQACTIDIVLPAVAGLHNAAGGTMSSDDLLEGVDSIENAGAGIIELAGARHDGLLMTLHNSGAGSMEVLDIRADRIEVDNPGTAPVVLEGEVNAADYVSSGAGSIDAEGLLAADVTVDNSGAGSVTVSASNSVAGSLSGAGAVRVHGSPDSRDVEVSGVGSVSYP